jgi:hypothetical protein
MICSGCGKWNAIDAKYCQYCGKSLNPSSFRINEYLKDNFHLFVIFGVFGGLSVYLSNFLNEINKSSELSKKIIVNLGIFEINYLAYGIGCSILLMIMIAGVLIYKAYYVPKEKIPLIYLTGWGAIERFAFTIPFIILVIGLIGYILNFFYDEMVLVFSPTFFLYGIVFVFILLTFVRDRYQMNGKNLFLSTLGFWILAGILVMISLQLKNTPIISTTIYSFATGMGQGVIPGFLFSIIVWIDEWRKSRSTDGNRG